MKRLAMLALAAAPAALALPAQAADTAPTTPPGITLVEVVRELSASAAQVLWVRPGDPDGHTLFTMDADGANASKCVDACAQEFPPLLAKAGAKPVGDWTLVKRADGSRQWAYLTKPLYAWSKEKEPGEVATNVGLTESANMKLAENPQKAGDLMPPPGWQVARFAPGAGVDVPDGIQAQLSDSAQGVVLTDFGGNTLYAFGGYLKREGEACGGDCARQWLPVAAPALAMNVGGFTVVSRADGSKQWAFKGKPLYKFAGDLMAGDVHGAGVNKAFTMALVAENFRPAQVTLASLDGYGDTLSVNGMTLYAGTAFQKYWGGRNLRDSFENTYLRGKKLGAEACSDASCEKMWKPLKAPADAQANGFWEPVARHDGTRQWAYKGYALYTYAGDKAPGQHYGQATYDFAKLEGDAKDMERSAFLAEVGKAPGGAGIYWNLAKP